MTDPDDPEERAARLLAIAIQSSTDPRLREHLVEIAGEYLDRQRPPQAEQLTPPN